MPARNFVVFSGECLVIAGTTSCDFVDLPPAPSGSIYLFSRVWNANFAYPEAANVLFSLESPGMDPQLHVVFRSMEPILNFGSISSRFFRLEAEFGYQATAITRVAVVFPSPVSADLRVPFVFQAEVVPLQ